jgi:sec-independent protein translocase protein TatC
MPFLDHLEELRWRIIWSLVAVIVGIGAGIAIVLLTPFMTWLEKPIMPYVPNGKLVFTHPGDPFSIIMQAAVGLGLLIALPVVLYQVWSFLSPALYKTERRIGVAVVAGAVVLFVCGASMGFLVVLPLAIPWLMDFGNGWLAPMITAGEYFSFAFSLTLAFGIAFELPVVLLGLSALGLVSPQLLIRFRRHALVASVIIGAFLTPGDLIWTTIAMAVPLYLLYEISIVLSYFVARRRQRAEAARMAEG